MPQASTGFSPFELLYGQGVCGPLSILRDMWTDEDPQDTDVVQYILQMRAKLSSMTELAQLNKQEAQAYQKAWYDQSARDRVYQVGDKVLVLMPTSTHKLQAQWQGPYTISRRVGDLDYELICGRRKRILHVNMLRKWHDRERSVYLAAQAERITDLDDQTKSPPIHGESETWEDVRLGTNLSVSEKQSIAELLKSYSSTLSSKPGSTDILCHQVLTTDDIPARQRPYRVPESMQNVVKSELDSMLANDIIEPANSPYASPIVLVRKADNTWRFCVDYRHLNAKTVFDATPMPRVDELIDKVGGAKFITTIDLSKGYWQIKLAEEAKKKSAFVTPFGSFRFKVMPFGMSCAGATFMRLMRNVLQGAEEYCDSYIDDIVIHSNTFDQHYEHLKDVLERLTKAGLTAKPSKCSVGECQSRYLGYIIGNGQI